MLSENLVPNHQVSDSCKQTRKTFPHQAQPGRESTQRWCEEKCPEEFFFFSSYGLFFFHKIVEQVFIPLDTMTVRE
jgi:hypothetical protein